MMFAGSPVEFDSAMYSEERGVVAAQRFPRCGCEGSSVRETIAEQKREAIAERKIEYLLCASKETLSQLLVCLLELFNELKASQQNKTPEESIPTAEEPNGLKIIIEIRDHQELDHGSSQDVDESLTLEDLLETITELTDIVNDILEHKNLQRIYIEQIDYQLDFDVCSEKSDDSSDESEGSSNIDLYFIQLPNGMK